MFDDFGINAGYVEERYALYRQSPLLVDERWRSFFRELEAPGAHANGNGAAHIAGLRESKETAAGKTNGVARAAAPAELIGVAPAQARVAELVNAYRVRGHLYARLDPLGSSPAAAPELALANFGLGDDDLATTFSTVGVAGLPPQASLREIIEHLSETYCRSIGVEYTHVEEPEMRAWLQEKMESTRNRALLDKSELIHILTKLADAEIFEQFIHKNFVNAKRFSLEGAESLIPMIDLLIEAAASHGLEEIVIGMAHRGRLNVLANIMGKNVREIFAAFDDKQPERFLGGGDVKYHLGYSGDRISANGSRIHLSLSFNPSHLEWVNPVVEGRVRAKQDRKKRRGVMPLLIHGDASFMGQGVVAETLNLAGLEGYTTLGTVHVVVNNQIGFTTLPRDGRSTRYCTDITRMMKVPVFHVNGEDPEAVIQVTRLATDFRVRFGKDVVIDMYCYRKYGHNEGDEPRFTQPLMYALIDKRPGVREVYVRKLALAGQVTREQADVIEQARKAVLEEAYAEAKKGDYLRHPNAMEGFWAPYKGGPEQAIADVVTGVPRQVLLDGIDRLTKMPEGFHPHPKVLKILEERREKAHAGKGLDWGTAEHLALATILLEGRPIRLTGQDACRGTFAHRHAVLFDTQTGESFTPLARIGTPFRSPSVPPPNDKMPDAEAPTSTGTRQGRFEIYDSPLSEAGVLGFEYGYSLDCPEGLVLWEAQFGDFLNSAQVIVDQFVVSAEDKWLRLSGIVLLLPHGYEGQGPEHSSARLERFLQMSAEDNIQVCNLTTPAQYFHALRRQVVRPWRKPLIVFTPKSLLRHRAATSTLDDLTSGHFQRVIGDASTDPTKVRKILFCSGKVYYDLVDTRTKLGRSDVAIVRLEQLYPLSDEIAAALAPYRDGTPLVWVQEEPRNMGAWYFLLANLGSAIGDRLPLSVCSRAPSASPATGSKASHELEQKMLMDEAFGR